MPNPISIAIVAFLVAANLDVEAPRDADGPKQIAVTAYCGIRSLHRAMTSLGGRVPFQDLISAKYVGSRSGSSLAELKLAAKERGFHALEIQNFKNSMLHDLRKPTILHFKGSPDRKVFDHWVLFLGISNGRALIGDGFDPLKEVGFDELTGLWDGSGLIISDQPIRPVGVLASSILIVMAYMGSGFIGLVAFRVISSFLSRFGGSGLSGSRVSLRFALTEVLSLLSITALTMSLYKGFDPDSGLTNRALIESVQSPYIFFKLSYVDSDCPELTRSRPDCLLVDARLPSDFEAGHLDGAINIPPSWKPEQYAARLSGIPKATTIVLYCQSEGCPFSVYVSKKLHDFGYHDLRIYKGGFAEWTRLGKHVSS